MKRTLLVVTLAFALSVSPVGVNAQTVETASKEEFKIDESLVELIQTEPEMIYERYSNVIDVQEIPLDSTQVSEMTEAYEYTEDGAVQGLDCEVTLNRITCQNNYGMLYSAEESTSTFYVMSVRGTSKTSEDSKTENGVTLEGVIGWEDMLGPVNKFEYASGSRSGSYTGTGQWQAMRGTHVLCSGDFDTSFYGTSSQSDLTGTSFRLTVRSATSGSKTAVLTFETSMFD